MKTEVEILFHDYPTFIVERERLEAEQKGRWVESTCDKGKGKFILKVYEASLP